MADLAEHEERAIRDYVNSQSPEDDQAVLVQRIQSRRILGRTHEIFDVHCAKTRWWVITDPTNLYLQTDFPQADNALIFHIGLSAVIVEGSRAEPRTDNQVSPSWRRYQDALKIMNDAYEAEDFQSVGLKCRDALISLGKEHQQAEWLGEILERPKAADFKGWAALYTERLAQARQRSYVKVLAEKTWDLTVWLQHNSNATPDDADFVLDATGHLIATITGLVRRADQDGPERCPQCESYRVDEDIQYSEDPEGFFESLVCGACGWSSVPEFTAWQDWYTPEQLKRISEYRSKPGVGTSDWLDRAESPSSD